MDIRAGYYVRLNEKEIYKFSQILEINFKKYLTSILRKKRYGSYLGKRWFLISATKPQRQRVSEIQAIIIRGRFICC